MKLSDATIADYARDGAVLIRGLFAGHVEQLRLGVEANLRAPGPYASENLRRDSTGRFFDDYCNWRRIAPFRGVITASPAAAVAAQLMRSRTAQLFHEHVLVKEPGTSTATPWHTDGPYYFVEGAQTVSFWVPLDAVTDATLRCVRGSHLWGDEVLPTRWASGDNFYPDAAAPFRPVPDPDAEGLEVLECAMAPGDAVAFHFRTLHGTRGNQAGTRRRAFSLRFVGDDARYVERQGPTSPPFPGHGMRPGDRLRDDWFPVLHRSAK